VLAMELVIMADVSVSKDMNIEIVIQLFVRRIVLFMAVV
jgi:hypothetical protein